MRLYRLIIVLSFLFVSLNVNSQINEEDIFYTLPAPSEAKQLLKKYAHKLSSEELEPLNEIVAIQREINPVYGY